MTGVNIEELANKLVTELPSSLHVHIGASSSLDRYPAKQHARYVAQHLGVENGLIYLPGAPTVYLEDSDQSAPFRQRRYFYYLSGVDEPDCHLTYDINHDTLTLFVPEVTPKKVIWSGRGSNPREALEKYDIDDAKTSSKLRDHVYMWLGFNDGDVYILHPDQAAIPGHDKSHRVNYTKLQEAIDRARVRKDAHEIKLIKKANEISAKAHEQVLRNIHKFENEAQVEAIFLNTCVAEDAKHQAYEIIAASGENAATLHYVKNDEPFGDRLMMCLDAGAEWQCYASDVTRTFPLSGKWPSKEAKEIYDLVQKMQTACIEAIRPGVKFLDLHYMAHRIAIDGLLELGIFHKGSAQAIFDAGTSLAFFPHGLGHHVGLEVHDVLDLPLTGSAVDAARVYQADFCKAPVHPNSGGLEEGMIVTVEPGIYFSRFALEELYFPSPVHSRFINKDVLRRYLSVGGVRIEDDILVTSNGYENLTTAPKGEEMMRIIREGLDMSDEAEVAKLRSVDNITPTPRTTIERNKKVIYHPDISSSSPELSSVRTQDKPVMSDEAFLYPHDFERIAAQGHCVDLDGGDVGCDPDLDPTNSHTEKPSEHSSSAPASFEADRSTVEEYERALEAEHPSLPELPEETPALTNASDLPEPTSSHWRKVPESFARLGRRTSEQLFNVADELGPVKTIQGSVHEYLPGITELYDNQNTPQPAHSTLDSPLVPSRLSEAFQGARTEKHVDYRIIMPEAGESPNFRLGKHPLRDYPAQSEENKRRKQEDAIQQECYLYSPPQLPQKVPELPAKPLAYRQSMPILGYPSNPAPAPQASSAKVACPHSPSFREPITAETPDMLPWEKERGFRCVFCRVCQFQNAMHGT